MSLLVFSPARVSVSRIRARNRRIRTRAKREVERTQAEIAAEQRLREDIANVVTHGAGLLMAVAGVPVLIVLGALRGGALHITSFAVYGTTLLLVYLASTLYHAFREPKMRRIFRILDHAAIYLLIAGTYTPFMVISLSGVWGWSLLTLVWVLAALGCLAKILDIDRFTRYSTAFYLAMGWLVVVAIEPIIAGLSPAGLGWLMAGGVCYTGGVIFFLWESLPFNHAIWHLFVIAGSVCHYISILLYVW